MSNWKQITLADLESLPLGYRQTVPAEWLDGNAHMNVMWYTHLFSCALGDLFKRVGLTKEYFVTNQAGTFALEGHIRYLNEVREGQTVNVRTRLIGRSEKRFHMLHFLVNEDRSVLSAMMEGIGTHVDLRVRRSSPLGPAVAAAMDELIAQHSRLPWEPPLCGAMRA